MNTKVAIKIVGDRRPDLGAKAAYDLAEALVKAECVGLGGDGEGFVIDGKREEADAIIGVPLRPKLDGATKNERARQREQHELARRAMAPVSRRPESIEGQLIKRINDDPSLQGTSAEAHARRAIVRGELLVAAAKAKGVDLSGLLE